MEENEEVLVKCKGGGSVIKQPGVFSYNGLSLYIPWKNVVRSFNVVTGERMSDLEGADSEILAAVLNPRNPKVMVACTRGGEVVSWRLKTELLLGKVRLSLVGRGDSVLQFLAVQPPGGGGGAGAPQGGEEGDGCELVVTWCSRGQYRLALFDSAEGRARAQPDMRIRSAGHRAAVGAEGRLLALVEGPRMQWCLLDRPGTVHRRKLGSGRKFTCVACHPELLCVATGDTSGRVVLWTNLTAGEAPAQAVYHWHTLPVRTVIFSHSGTFFYSGAGECVLVKWTVDNPYDKGFLPRLSAPIEHLAVAPENLHLAVSTADNAIRVVDAHFRLRSVVQHLVRGAPFRAGLAHDPRTRSLVLNGQPGHLQFYSPANMALLFNLDVVAQNRVTQERNLDIPNTDVTAVSLSRTGEWLATAEERHDAGRLREGRLKFWHFDPTDQTFALNTSAELPHEGGVVALEFQPSASCDDFLCVSAGRDASFKVWGLQDTSTIYKASRGWWCQCVGRYRDLEARAVSFSTDGSVLGAAFGGCLTLWTADSCELRASLVRAGGGARPLRHLRFGSANQCHLVAAADEDGLCVWNLLTLALVWAVPVRVARLCADPCGTHMAAFTDDDQLFVFQPSCSSVVFSKRRLCSGGERVVGAAFVPHATAGNVGLRWQANSRLYFLSSSQELLCLETKNEQSDDLPLEFARRPQRSVFSATVAGLARSDVRAAEPARHRALGLAGAMSVRELVDPPAYTMAPMRLLCAPVLRSFVRTGEAPLIRALEPPSAVSDASLPEEAEDLPPRRRQPVGKPPLDEDAEQTASVLDELLLEESNEWISLLL